MAFPSSLPSYTITAGSETLNGAAGGTGLSGLLNALEVDVTALGTKLGTGSSTATSNAVLAGTGSGTSAWATTLAGLTLTTPTIASFTNATHDHSNAAGGGQLTSTGLATNAVTTAKITNANVTADKLATGATTTLVATSETTASATFADLATSGPAATVTIGANGIALVGLYVASSNPANQNLMGFAVSGATTQAAADNFALETVSTVTQRFGTIFLVTGLTAGSNVFTAKYRVTGNTGTFLDRRIVVVPL